MDDETLRRIYAETKTIVAVGASENDTKPGHKIPRYLSGFFRVIPVSPKGGELFGEHVYPSLDAVEGPVDVVDVFRPPEEAADIARAALALGAKVLWFQPSTESPEGERIAREGGLEVVSGRCMGVMHGKLGLGPGPYADEEG